MPGIIYNDNWHVASLFDEDGNVVQFNILVGGETGFETEPINQEHTAGDYQSGERNAVMLASTEYDGLDQLRDWKADNTPVAAVAICRGRNGRNLRWISYRKLQELTDVPQPQRSEGDSFIRTVIEDFDVDPIRQRNLIYEEDGPDIILPIAGETLTLAAELDAPFDLTLSAYDYGTDGTDGAELDSVTESFDDERGSVELELPADTWRVQWDLDGAEEGSLRADGQTKYVEG